MKKIFKKKVKIFGEYISYQLYLHPLLQGNKY